MTTKPETALLLRTCEPDMTSYGGFRWPESGPVAAPDWDPRPECGNGLHGLLWGIGDGDLLRRGPDVRWLVVAVDPATIVDLVGKVKVPAGEVVFCGDRVETITYLEAHGAADKAIVFATRTGGDRSTLTGGDRSTLTGGYGSTLTGGDRSTLTGGYGSTLLIARWDPEKGRYRKVLAEVGEDGIEPGIAYRLSDAGLYVPVARTEVSA